LHDKYEFLSDKINQKSDGYCDFGFMISDFGFFSEAKIGY